MESTNQERALIIVAWLCNMHIKPWWNLEIVHLPHGFNVNNMHWQHLFIQPTSPWGRIYASAERVRPQVQWAFSALVRCLHKRVQFHFVEASFCSTGSLIYKYWPVSAPYSCGSCRKITLRAIFAGARIGPAAEAWQTRGGVNSTTQFLQTYPLRSPCIPWICYERSYSEF